jgi:hypothetical protein
MHVGVLVLGLMLLAGMLLPVSCGPECHQGDISKTGCTCTTCMGEQTTCENGHWVTAKCSELSPDASGHALREAGADTDQRRDSETAAEGGVADVALQTAEAIDGAARAIDASTTPLDGVDGSIDVPQSLDAECHPGDNPPCTCITCLGRESLCENGRWVTSQCELRPPDSGTYLQHEAGVD